ncbi:cytochrome P450 monooxygenase [Colletotrichum spaethianum]|uniref:Cytochrome P450 monooxygenase n=1 Tax=Colletotrichum spaethianum TaxID=700344 RepID=A0AA37P7J2_9PEZI|nr:cytochrome P450 monooxygenase [Colletotrichum spaethianum]GKT44194.1 cytochrome P450 monooxygenase [Colletotrichum spaethianum]
MGSNLIPIVIASVAAWLFYHFIVHPLFLSPLSNIPVPHWSCHISPLWILYMRKTNCQNRTLHQAHIRHGPVVRIAPNELSVDGYDALKTVYQGGFEKDEWYSIFDNYGGCKDPLTDDHRSVPCMFSTLSSKPHSLRKRMISNAYSKSFIHASEAANAQSRTILFERLLPVLSASAFSEPLSGAGIDVFSMFLATTMDFITTYVFGLRNATDFIRDKAYRDHWLQLYLARANHGFWPQELPRLTALCAKVTGGRWKPYPAWVDDANAEIAAWNRKLCEAADDSIRGRSNKVSSSAGVAGKQEGEDPVNEPVVFRALEAGIEKERLANGAASLLYQTTILQKDLSMASEVMDQVLAGQETAGIALTYLAWHLSKSPGVQLSLHHELLTLSPSLVIAPDSSFPSPFPDPKQVDALPLLHAVIMETLRLHAPIPGPEPRRTPHHPPCRLGGFHVPGGVRVAALGYTLHRNVEVFPDPEAWDPTRWLDESGIGEERRREMMRYFWAFGSGGRMCVGSNFAMNEMKLIAAAIWTNFTTHIVDDTDIDQDDTYTARPKAERLFLRFEHV